MSTTHSSKYSYIKCPPTRCKEIKPKKSVRELELENEIELLKLDLMVAKDLLTNMTDSRDWFRALHKTTETMLNTVKWEVEGLKYCIDRMIK